MRKKLILSSAALILIVGFSFMDLNKSNAGPGECNLTGYKIWEDAGLWGNQNFYDCQCVLRRGKNPQACVITPQ